MFERSPLAQKFHKVEVLDETSWIFQCDKLYKGFVMWKCYLGGNLMEISDLKDCVELFFCKWDGLGMLGWSEYRISLNKNDLEVRINFSQRLQYFSVSLFTILHV